MASTFKFIALLLVTATLSSCSFLLGSKKDKQVDQVFEQGRIDPLLYPSTVGYVPILPQWNIFSNPVDVYVGYDEMIYVIDDKGLSILDLKGELKSTIPFLGATDVVQDKRIHTYVCARILKDINNDGVMENLPAIFHLKNASSLNGPIFIDTLIHPFCDPSRGTSTPTLQDELVSFTGVAPMYDNSIYIARTGPNNSLAGVALPDNVILRYDELGNSIGYCANLSPDNSSLKSVMNLGSICTSVVPPQGYDKVNNNFYITQTNANAEYKVLSIKEVTDPEAGISYIENTDFLNKDYTKASSFLYDPFKFKNPTDVFKSNDANSYIFVVDASTDSVYQFTSRGFEGVNPPANQSASKQILVSFGGSGNGPYQFNQPSGVCYYKKMLYVADKGNNRICRFKLSTDLEQ